MADKSKIRMNLAAIKKVDPYAKDIVDSSAHVAFYTFNSEKNEWEKTDVEGAFFIYRRNAEPFNSIFINNRLNTTSFVEPITSQFEIQSQPPFLLYRNERSRIRGFWFYNSSECDRIGELLKSLLQESDTESQKTPNIATSGMQRPNINIFNLLSKAQSEVCIQNMANNHLPSRNVLNFFAAAKPNSFLEISNYQKLIPKSLSVEQLEKHQRAKTPQEEGSKISFASGLETSALAYIFNSVSSKTNMEQTQQSTKIEMTTTNPRQVSSNLQPDKAPEVGYISKPALMPPTMFENVHSVSSCKALIPVGLDPLNITQFTVAFRYLIKNDADFIQKLHEAYLNTFSGIKN